MPLDLPGLLRALQCLVSAALVGGSSDVLAKPPNDDFADRIPLTGEDLEFEVDLDGARLGSRGGADGPASDFEPLYGSYAAVCAGGSFLELGSAWWEWKAPRAGTVLVRPVPSPGQSALPEYLPQVAVFRRPWEPTSAHPLHPEDLPWPVAAAQRCPHTVRYASVAFHAEAGEVFLLQALGVHGAVGHFRLQMPRGPFLFESPTDRTLRVGETSFLNVVATGYLRSDPPAGRWLDYQWLHDGRALPGENFASLLLSRVDVSSAGAYQVVVSDSEGSVTSAVARVVVSDHEMPPVLLSDCARGGIGGATQPPCWTLHGERGRYYVIESSSNLVDWAWQPVVAEGPLPDERFSPGAYEPVRAAAHVLLAEGSFAFRPASVDRSLFLRARRVQPLDEGRLALLWIVDLAKEELARALLPSSAPSDGYSLPDVEPLVPRVVSRVGFSGDNDCHGAVVLGGLAAPTTWPCVPLTLESALDPYWSTAPRPVWNARGSSH